MTHFLCFFPFYPFRAGISVFPIHLTAPERTTDFLETSLVGWTARNRTSAVTLCVAVCGESNVKDAYFLIRNNSFFQLMASVAVLSVAVCCASAYISRADVGSVRVLVGLVRSEPTWVRKGIGLRISARSHL